MAEDRSFAGEKTEQPTPHRRREARRRGQVAKSMELNAAINMLGMVTLFLILGEGVFHKSADFLSSSLGKINRPPLAAENTIELSGEVFIQFFSLAAPVLLTAVVLGLGANLFQIGFLVAPNQLVPQLDRLNPLSGLRRIISRKALFEMIKVIFKVLLFGTVVFFYLKGRIDELLLLLNEDVSNAALTFWNIVVSLGLRVAIAYLLVAALDYIYQRYEFEQSLRMSRREVQEEYKQMEGDPHLRAKIREKQRYFAQQRMLSELPTADVVITNPTHLAVALRYREKEDHAPVLVAKGAGVIAHRMREIAAEHKIPIIENKEVARILFMETEIGEEIPEKLYRAVAEILALIYQQSIK
ncbi:MAG: flagellar biosynthesis protein FlhB [Dethiobacteria bacterium]|jgi:flagellar biosynthetic protein FlhB|nr:flagellar biosynthesis protein FlhB [Bacillota bacterium]